MGMNQYDFIKASNLDLCDENVDEKLRFEMKCLRE